MRWNALIPELGRPSQGSNVNNRNDPFVKRYHKIDNTIVERRPGANFPALRGSYEQWKAFIEDAVDQNAQPSRELVLANEMLAAWESHLGIGKVSSFPVTVGFSLTDVCNARCVFCAYVPERVIEERITLERIEKADWLRFCKNFTPNGGGLGEPFAHPDFIKILKKFKQNAPYLNFGSITNASLLRPAVIKEITGYVTYLYISMNSARKETYEKTMRPLKWDKMISNLTHLREEKEKLGTQLPRLRCGFVVHKHNMEELPELPAILNKLGFTDLNVNFMVPPPHSESRQLYGPEDTVYNEPEQANLAFRALEQECERYKIALVKPLPGLKLLKLGRQVPVPNEQDLPTSVSKTTGFYTVSSKESPENTTTVKAINGKTNGANATTSPKDSTDPYEFDAYHSLHQPANGKHAGSFLDRFLDSKETDMPDNLAAAAGKFDRGVSYEWIRFAARGQPAFCWAPWRMLKIDIFERTLICCNFFGKLPTFDWPSAAQFHEQSRMWNHPFMQHLRQTMDTPEELPYCTFCKTMDKRHLANTEIKEKAREESIKIYNLILDKNEKVTFNGTIDQLDQQLDTFSVQIGNVAKREHRPFSRNKGFYRRLVRQKGFIGLGHVLQIGASGGAITPFLAEAGNQLTLLDDSSQALKRLSNISTSLGLNINTVLTSQLPFDFKDHAFDGIWLDGKWLGLLGRTDLLTELRRILKPSGRLHVSQAPAVGQRVLELLEQPSKLDAIHPIIEQGPDYTGQGNFFSTAKLLDILDDVGFETDRTLPSQPIRIGSRSNKLPPIGRGHKVIALRLQNPKYLEKLCQDQSPLDGLERFISFTAMPKKVIRPNEVPDHTAATS